MTYTITLQYFDYYRLINIHSYLFQHAFKKISIIYIYRKLMIKYTHIHVRKNYFRTFFYNNNEKITMKDKCLIFLIHL